MADPLLDLTSFLPELKDYYHDEKTKALLYKNRPLLGMISKRTDWQGSNWELPLQYGVTQGLGATFATAQANKEASKHVRFSIPVKKYYALADVDNHVIETSMSDKGSFLRALTSEIDGAFLQFANESAHALYGDGTGSRGVVSAWNAGTNTITLTDPENIVHFEVGMFIDYNATVGTTTEVEQITSVNRTAGTFVITEPTGGTDPAASDFIWRDGDANLKMEGLEAWLDPAGATLHGVTRTTDLTRMSGIHYDASSGGTNENVEDAIIGAGARAFREGATPDIVVMNPTQVAVLDRLLESGSNHRSRFDKVKSADAELGFDAIKFHTPAGVMSVVSDPYCPVDNAYMLDLSTWSLRSAGQWGKFLGRGSFDQGILRNASSDSVEFRIGGYGNLGCSAPGRNVRIVID